MVERFAPSDAKVARKISFVLSIALLAVSMLALVGWATGVLYLTNLDLSMARTSAPTALGLAVLAAVSLAVGRDAISDWRRRTVIIPGLVLVGGATLFCITQYSIGNPSAVALLGPDLGTVSLATCVLFLLVTIAVVLRDKAPTASVTLLTVGLVIVLVDAVSYVYRVDMTERILSFKALAPTTSFSFLTLTVALLLQRPEQNWTQLLFWRDRIGGTFKLFALAIIIVPLALGGLISATVDGGLVFPKFGFSIMAVATILPLVVLLCGATFRIARDDDNLTRTHDSMQQAFQIFEAAEVSAGLCAFVRKQNPQTGQIETFWTPGANRIFGLPEDVLAGHSLEIEDYIHPDDADVLKDITAGIHARTNSTTSIDAAPTEHTFRIIRPDGVERWLRKRSYVATGSPAAHSSAVGIVQDVTESRKIESQLFQAQKMETVGNLTGGMAHDINNVLGIIVGNIDLLTTRLADPKDRALAQEVLDAALNGSDLMRSLLAFARRQPLRPEPADVNGLVAHMVALLRTTLGEKIEIKLDLDESLAPAIADIAQLEAAILNLANNARDAMPEGGAVHIVTANRRLDADYARMHAEVQPGEYAMIEISDTGIGMPPDVVDKVFEPFFTTKETGRGTGLGLSMVYGFAKQIGGHINVYSEEGFGSTFRLYLPRTDADSRDEALPLERARSADAQSSIVLAVEDNVSMRRVVVRQLGEMGYEVLEAGTGAEALEILQKQQVDILFTDIVMPGEIDGIDLARRARELWPDLRIVLTSGFPEATVNGRGKYLGNFQLLNKPYRKDQLADALRAE